VGGCEVGILKSVVVLGTDARSEGQRGAIGDIAERVLTAGDVDSAITMVTEDGPDLVVADGTLPAEQTLRLLRSIRRLAEHVPVVVVAKSPKVDQAVKFIRAGALDYLPGPLDRNNALKLLAGMRAESGHADHGYDRWFSSACPSGVEIVGKSDGMVTALETIRIVAESRCNPILITGETGTGKELAAKAVHAWRSGGAENFVAVNCAALNANLLESELFGHVKGAFTGAAGSKPGLFEVAGEGTIFLDEISEMPVDLQPKLLRVLQEKTFRRVGGVQDIVCKATVVASSNRNLAESVKEGKLRRDLYYRLTVFPIKLPPLRSPARRSDIALLAEYFSHVFAGPADAEPCEISPAVRRRLEEHLWPGNVRELRNVVERASILARGRRITPDHLLVDPCSDPQPASTPAKTAAFDPDDFSLEAAERQFIWRALQETGWQRTRAAALLGITRATLHAKLKRYNISPPEGTGSSQPGQAQPAQPGALR